MPAPAAGVLVVNQSGGNAHSVAEHALAMMLTLSKRIIEADRALRRDANVNRNALIGTEVQGKTVGIIGIGNVGRRIAELCKGLLGMKVLAYDPYLTAAEIAARGGEKVELDDLLRAADYVSISCPLTKDNRGMIGAREFALMQPHAYFITTARGFIHDEAALLDALRNKKIAGAGLDVWAKEPPPPDHPLLQFDNVLASPHTAGVTKEARANMGRIAAEQVLDALDGKRPPRIVNPRGVAGLCEAVRARVRIRAGISLVFRTRCSALRREPGIQSREPLSVMSGFRFGPALQRTAAKGGVLHCVRDTLATSPDETRRP